MSLSPPTTPPVHTQVPGDASEVKDECRLVVHKLSPPDMDALSLFIGVEADSIKSLHNSSDERPKTPKEVTVVTVFSNCFLVRSVSREQRPGDGQQRESKSTGPFRPKKKCRGDDTKMNPKA